MMFDINQLQLHFNHFSRATKRASQFRPTGRLPEGLTQIYWLASFVLKADWLLQKSDWNFVVACGATL